MARIALGISGGISAYKSVEVVRRLQQDGHEVTVVMTAAACRFVGSLTFEAITGRAVITDQFTPGANANIEHIALASNIELLIVAPATANVIGKFANGLSDDFLSSMYLATKSPVLIAPAMNSNMLAHASVQENLRTLADRDVHVIDSGVGYLACGWLGKGRMAESEEIVTAAQRLLCPPQAFVGRSVLVTAGPTYEDLDPVRYFGNRSTGRMGFAVAAEALGRGARVLLVTGPTSLEPPIRAEISRVRSADEMREAVLARLSEVDVVVMAAAVADYTPAVGRQPEKIKKSDGDLEVQLKRTPDILAEIGGLRAGASVPVLVGFAAETSNVVEHARNKLRAKQLDMVVANDVSRPETGFAVETNAATLVTSESSENVPLGTKRELAAALLDHVETLLRSPAVL